MYRVIFKFVCLISRLRECCNAVLMLNSSNVSWTMKLYPTCHMHAAE